MIPLPGGGGDFTQPRARLPSSSSPHTSGRSKLGKPPTLRPFSKVALRINIPQNGEEVKEAEASMPVVECGGGCAHGRGVADGGNGRRSEELTYSRMRRLLWETPDGRLLGRALSTWDIVELLVVEYVREVLGVDLGRVAVDLDARRGLAGQYPHPERQLLALKG